jgi:hypothetical protein
MEGIMANEIPAAVITSAGAIGAAWLTYFLTTRSSEKNVATVSPPSVVSDLQALAIAIPANSGIQTSSSVREAHKTTIIPVLYKSRPFDTSIACNVTGEALIFKIPPSYSGIFGILFLCGWLIAWTVGIFAAAMAVLSMSPQRSSDWLGFLFMCGWLVGALAGEYWAMNSLLRGVMESFGSQALIFTKDALFHVRRLLFVKIASVYVKSYINNLIEKGDSLQFDYGKKKIQVGGMTELEAKWIRSGVEEYNKTFIGKL